MTDVFIASDNILSPIGFTTNENFSKLKQAVTGVKKQDDTSMSAEPFYASLFSKNIALKEGVTKFEKILIASIQDALNNCDISATDDKTLLIISSTKGNINLLKEKDIDDLTKTKIGLYTSAKNIATYFGCKHIPLVVSNACISGLLGLITGMRLIQSGQYNNVIVAGADVISKFVLSGFQSFQAISQQPCKPFDANRNGINLGEGASTIILTSNKEKSVGVKIMGGSVTNDANHISGPSRTGEELNFAISKALQQSGLTAADIDFISAHGTATLYNDEMETKAINLANMQSVPVNSLKGYYGHTLGAAGLIESTIAIHSLKNNIIMPTLGYQEHGVTQPLNVCKTLQNTPLKNCLKTASGFGGCNAAIVFGKH